jgi:hypothetical protein
MLITESHKDVPTKAGGDMSEWSFAIGMVVCSANHDRIGIFLFHPTIPNYPKAKFPGVVVFSEIYQGELLDGCVEKVVLVLRFYVSLSTFNVAPGHVQLLSPLNTATYGVLF